jgi:hypothetical protein
MNNRNAANGGRVLPKDGDIAYFIHLHLDTVVEECKHPQRPAERIYRVEGKPRPMLVLRHQLGREYGKCRFWVCPITSRGDAKGNPRRGYEPIGKCIDGARKSFVSLEPLWLPENMLHGESPIVKPCEPLAFQNAIKVINHKALGRRF